MTNDDAFPTAGRRTGSVDPHPDYEKLPECVKASFSERDYAAMPDEEKRTLLEDITMPEVEDTP